MENMTVSLYKVFHISNTCSPLWPDILLSICFGTYLLTPWSRVLLEKLTDSQLIKKFLGFCVTRRFITAITKARHLSLFLARYFVLRHSQKSPPSER
jgi:hypothetical protein